MYERMDTSTETYRNLRNGHDGRHTNRTVARSYADSAKHFNRFWLERCKQALFDFLGIDSETNIISLDFSRKTEFIV